jgi:hypothetical protein
MAGYLMRVDGSIIHEKEGEIATVLRDHLNSFIFIFENAKLIC